MKKALLYLTLTLALLAGLWTTAGSQTGTNWLTRSILRTQALSYGGVIFQSTTNAVTPNGMKLNADTGDIETYKGGVVAGRNRGTSWMPPECPSDTSTMGIGVCYDQATGRMKLRDAAGVRDL